MATEENSALRPNLLNETIPLSIVKTDLVAFIAYILFDSTGASSIKNEFVEFIPWMLFSNTQ